MCCYYPECRYCHERKKCQKVCNCTELVCTDCINTWTENGTKRPECEICKTPFKVVTITRRHITRRNTNNCDCFERKKFHIVEHILLMIASVTIILISLALALFALRLWATPNFSEFAANMIVGMFGGPFLIFAFGVYIAWGICDAYGNLTNNPYQIFFTSLKLFGIVILSSVVLGIVSVICNTIGIVVLVKSDRYWYDQIFTTVSATNVIPVNYDAGIFFLGLAIIVAGVMALSLVIVMLYAIWLCCTNFCCCQIEVEQIDVIADIGDPMGRELSEQSIESSSDSLKKGSNV